MGKIRRFLKKLIRADPKSQTIFVNNDEWDDLTVRGYCSLDKNPEVMTAVDHIAQLISSMTIHLMENRDDGDVRIINELSRKIDIEPNQHSTRATFIYWIVKTMLLKGNAVVMPITNRGYLDSLEVIPPNKLSFNPISQNDYEIFIDGVKFSPEELLHFTINPSLAYPWKGEGYQVILSNVVKSLTQADNTKNSFMASKWKPSLIVKVDALTEEFSSPEGREKLLESYMDTTTVGQPWMIPADQFDVKEVRPLTLADLAISETVELDKRTVAAIMGVPPFLLGVGEFKRDAWNNFVSTKIMYFATVIQQELTKKLLISPKMFFKFNSRSLYNYDLRELAQVADDQYVRGVMDGNEVRDWLGLPPREGLNELVILENYIPLNKIDQQSKLNGGDN